MFTSTSAQQQQPPQGVGAEQSQDHQQQEQQQQPLDTIPHVTSATGTPTNNDDAHSARGSVGSGGSGGQAGGMNSRRVSTVSTTSSRRRNTGIYLEALATSSSTAGNIQPGNSSRRGSTASGIGAVGDERDASSTPPGMSDLHDEILSTAQSIGIMTVGSRQSGSLRRGSKGNSGSMSGAARGDSSGNLQSKGDGEEEEPPQEDNTVQHAADEWLKKELPCGLQFLYENILLVCLDENDVFAVVMRKICVAAGFMYSFCSIALGAYWCALAADDSNKHKSTSLVVAGIGAIAVAAVVFMPTYVYCRCTRTASSALCDFWIIGIAVCFCAISLGVPTFPVTTAMYALSEAAILMRGDRMALHLIVAVIVFACASYTNSMGKLGWSLITLETGGISKVHEGSPAEALIFCFLSVMIVVLMSGALFLQFLELVRMVGRSTSTSDLSKNVSTSLRKMDMKAVSKCLRNYKRAETGVFDAEAFNSTVSIVKTISQFARFAPRAVIGDMLARSGKIDMSMKNDRCTILFVDQVSFTSLVDAVDPATLNNLLTCYFETFGRILERHFLVCLKTIGDCIMSKTEQHTKNGNSLAVACTLSLQGAAKAVLAPMYLEHGCGFGVRIGAAYGEVLTGIVGSRQRLAYDCLGALPTLASRLESLGKHVRSNITVNAEVLRETLVAPPAGHEHLCSKIVYDEFGVENVAPVFAARRVGLVLPKGKSEDKSVAVYQVLGVLPHGEALIGGSLFMLPQQGRGRRGSGLSDSLRSSGSTALPPPMRGDSEVTAVGGGPLAALAAPQQQPDVKPPPVANRAPSALAHNNSGPGGDSAPDSIGAGDEQQHQQQQPHHQQQSFSGTGDADSLTGNHIPVAAAGNPPPAAGHPSYSAPHSGLLSPGMDTNFSGSAAPPAGLWAPGGGIGGAAGQGSSSVSKRESSDLLTSSAAQNSAAASFARLDAANAVAEAGTFFRASVVVIDLVNTLNEAQLLYERGHFEQAVAMIEHILDSYDFGDQQGLDDTVDQILSLAPDEMDDAHSSSSGSSGGSGGRNKKKGERRSMLPTPSATFASTNNKKKQQQQERRRERKRRGSQSRTPPEHPPAKWPSFMEDAMLDEEFLLDKLDEYIEAAERPASSGDWTPVVKMSQK